MLWYDTNRKRTLEERLNEAIDYFIKKTGHLPLACFVHPESISSVITIREHIKVIPDAKILRNHIWLEFIREKNSSKELD